MPILGKIVLILCQLAGGYFLVHLVGPYIPVNGVLHYVLNAVLFAVCIWLIGILGAQFIKGINSPQSSSFFYALALGLVGAAILIAPSYIQGFHFTLPFSEPSLPLMGAVLGYQFGK
jgi:hypothetical protein